MISLINGRVASPSAPTLAEEYMLSAVKVNKKKRKKKEKKKKNIFFWFN
jgi:hypothetical protein